MKCDKYILNDLGQPVPEPDLFTWAMWYEKGNRVVKQELIGGIRVSTIFTGLDSNWMGNSPVLWETMAFNNALPAGADGRIVLQRRCGGNKEQAEAMHEEAADEIRKQQQQHEQKSRPG